MNSVKIDAAFPLHRSGAVCPAIWAAAICLGLGWGLGGARADSAAGAARFHKAVQPVLTEYCYDCHGDGMDKGGVAFDQFKSDDALMANRDLWWTVLKYVRAGLMPPAKKPRPPASALDPLQAWIKADVFGADPKNPDPGRVTIRRLNRVEYRNTIRDLMGYDFKADEEFPPDDSGYGFDNIGDVLTISPLLLEKYMQAAESIVSAAVPTVPKVMGETVLNGSQFRGSESGITGERLSFYKEAAVSNSAPATRAGDYRVVAEVEVSGAFDFDPGRCRVVFKIDGQEQLGQEFGWQNNKRFHFEFEKKNWAAGTHHFSFELKPLIPVEKKVNTLDFRVIAVKIQGPLDPQYWTRTKNYDRFFTKPEPPQDTAERRKYAAEVLGRFAGKAFRRPADARTVDRLAGMAASVFEQKGKRFEEGIGQAMVAVLASPRFLFRMEEALASQQGSGRHPWIDEWSLATRLSYFLWSSMPDDELFQLAEQRELRKNLAAQVERMLHDPRSQALIENFTGQWLQVRDVDGIAINERAVLARENRPAVEQEKAATQKRPRQFRRPAVELDRDLRRAMRQETELFFGRIVREDRSVLELLDSDYTYANERLARHYGIPGITGKEMQLVKFPTNSPRGGLLTEGSILVVTSNPTRTSPVKRGQFILDNILGLPAAPPPPDIPQLEASEKDFKDREPALREVLAVHRDKPLCASCHARMDPLGLALENFNALGMWREAERSQPIDASGKLITGETFHDIRDLKRILKEKHSVDFYRCLTEKLLTYALGRGLEYYDVETVDQIVGGLKREQGRFSELLNGIIESAPFQKRRGGAVVEVAKAGEQTARKTAVTKSKL